MVGGGGSLGRREPGGKKVASVDCQRALETGSVMRVASGAQAWIGIIGCGNISEKYVRGMLRYATLKLVGCADRNAESVATLASSTGIKAYPSVSALIDDPAVDVVVNITPPTAHAQVAIDALAAGKHVYVEKPLGVNLKEGERMRAAARANGRLLGAAPDTFLGSAIQTARAALVWRRHWRAHWRRCLRYV